MKRIILILALLAAPAAAQDFSAGSGAKTWNLYAEKPARFEAKVVDILCELTGDCPENCGDGRRQLGLLRAADKALVYPNKNAQAAFTGAALELLPYCSADVEVDGLLIEDPDLAAKNIYLVQKIRLVGEENWTKANSWTKKWAKANPDAKGKGPWFRRDPRVRAAIAEDGYTGIGVEAEQPFIKELFE
ncbi:hypothetical protein PEL8287_02106 [Roseovarius litorisediminis]|uniref:Uncharacterized protein n=1 Tax=Roseovarius litorisediminis TaxID=1312363 RepID=A0A1Y5SKE7_9RHOB|nr:hypothetical protein [Roseovarius litorisediminis]SLN42485.1 hypothetical protein PEL8287_02106 [Roseovarius litorisediminis]